MADATAITLMRDTEDHRQTAVSQTFAILVDRLLDLTRLESDIARNDWREYAKDRADHLSRLRFAVLDAAQDALATPAEHPLDGRLHRLATLCELQMTLHCPVERAGLFAQVMDNFDLFEISGESVAHRYVRNMQQVFFTRYAELVNGPQMAAVFPETCHSSEREPIPA